MNEHFSAVNPSEAEELANLTDADIDSGLSELKTVGGEEAKDVNRAQEAANEVAVSNETPDGFKESVLASIEESLDSDETYGQKTLAMATVLVECLRTNPEKLEEFSDEYFGITDKQLQANETQLDNGRSMADLRVDVAGMIIRHRDKFGLTGAEIDRLIEVVAGNREWLVAKAQERKAKAQQAAQNPN
jgi:hypothetical protein